MSEKRFILEMFEIFILFLISASAFLKNNFNLKGKTNENNLNIIQ